MHWGLAPAWICALAACGQTIELAPEVAALARIRVAMSQTLARQPNYTCIQQIERSHRHLPRRRFELHDVLRLEVALVDGKEMFAWPGAHKFEQTDLTEMVSDGAIGTGDFAMHARAVFQTSAPTFKYAGPLDLRGHKAAQFDFVVPLIGSGYRIKAGGREAIVGYHGSLWADTTTHELLRLEVNADDIPLEVGIRSARDVMDYGRIEIGASEFLLPVGSELAMVDLSGNESRNRTQFKSCRQYTGESVLTFAPAPTGDGGGLDDTPAALQPGRPDSPMRSSSVEIPPGLTLDIRLVTDIDSAGSAVGDPVTATLDRNLKSGRQLLVAKGATLAGRILRLERHGDFVTVDLQFSEIESGGVRSSLLARIDETAPPLPSASVRSLPLAPENGMMGGSGMRVRGDRIHLRAGSRLRLRTLAAMAPAR